VAGGLAPRRVPVTPTRPGSQLPFRTFPRRQAPRRAVGSTRLRRAARHFAAGKRHASWRRAFHVERGRVSAYSQDTATTGRSLRTQSRRSSSAGLVSVCGRPLRSDGDSPRYGYEGFRLRAGSRGTSNCTRMGRGREPLADLRPRPSLLGSHCGRGKAVSFVPRGTRRCDAGKIIRGRRATDGRHAYNRFPQRVRAWRA
jgi:hypothetical protein